MVEKISVKLTDQIISYRLVSDNLRDWYIYAFLRIFETGISLATMIAIAFVAGRLVHMILFWMFFNLLRRRTGGFHFDKYWECYIATTITFVGVIAVEPFLSVHPVLLYSLLSISVFEIMIIGTINHPNMDYNHQELKKSKKLSRFILSIEIMIILSFSMIGVKEIYLTYMSIGIILCAVLMGFAKIYKQEVKTDERTK